MKIRRYVNCIGMEFELTYNELMEAHSEWQESCDREDILNAFEDMTDDDLMEVYGKTREEIEPLVGQMARRYRKYMNKYSEDWLYQRDEAIFDVLSEHRKETEYEAV